MYGFGETIIGVDITVLTVLSDMQYRKSGNFREIIIILYYTLVGNMIDCHGKKRAVSTREASARAQQLGVDYIEASSLEYINIDKVNLLLVADSKYCYRIVIDIFQDYKIAC